MTTSLYDSLPQSRFGRRPQTQSYHSRTASAHSRHSSVGPEHNEISGEVRGTYVVLLRQAQLSLETALSVSDLGDK